LLDEQHELALRKRTPQDIVQEVQHTLNTHLKNPPRLVTGRRPLSKPGNIVYAFSGEKLIYADILPLAKYLLGPFDDSGILVPTNGWVWAQI